VTVVNHERVGTEGLVLYVGGRDATDGAGVSLSFPHAVHVTYSEAVSLRRIVSSPTDFTVRAMFAAVLSIGELTEGL
jgi:hypothetical protein